MYDLEKIKEECNKVCNELGVKMDVPITLNKRLTLTLGRVINGYVDGVYNPTAVEFSSEMLSSSTDSTIHSVIQHEMVHYYITKTTHERHGHDLLFKEVCARIGCKNDGYATHVDRTVSADAIYKYIVFCPTCHKPVAYYRKAGKVIKNIKSCTCRVCGGDDLYVVQNW